MISISARPNAKLIQLWAFRSLFTYKVKCASTVQQEVSAQHYNIIICGGGLVGTTLACALSKTTELADKSIMLLDRAPPFKGFHGEQYSNRVSAINNASVELFKAIGAWKHMHNERVKHVKQMQVWDASSDAMIGFHFDNFTNDVACIVENDLMLHSVYKELGNVKLRTKSRIASVQLPHDDYSSSSKIKLENGESFSCDLLIGADGANSIVRSEMGVNVYSIDYESTAVVATLELEDSASDNSVAWQRFIPSGPVALLPLNNGMSSMVWSTSPANAQDLISMPAAKFVNELNEAFCREYPKSDIVVKATKSINSCLGCNSILHSQYPPKVSKVVENSRASFPLGFLHASSYVSNGAVLVGDAAHRVHPLAGQGVNLGFSDVRNLVEVLSSSVYSGANLGDKQYLLKYEQKSLINNVPLMIGVHGLHSLYSTSFSPIVLLRSVGLHLTHNIPQIKKFFMQRAIS